MTRSLAPPGNEGSAGATGGRMAAAISALHQPKDGTGGRCLSLPRSDASPLKPQLPLPVLEPVAHEEAGPQQGHGRADACTDPGLLRGQGTVLSAEHVIDRPVAQGGAITTEETI